MAISTKDKDVLERGKPSAEKRSGDGVSRPRPGVADYLAGEASSFQSNLTPYLPHEVIGGAVPHIPGTEEEAVWNAAWQAPAYLELALRLGLPLASRDQALQAAATTHAADTVAAALDRLAAALTASKK